VPDEGKMLPSKPLIESLEQRQLMSISVVNHVLAINGAMNEPDTIMFGLAPGGQSIYAELSYPTAKGLYSKTMTFPLSRNFRMVSVNGGNKADVITVDQTNGSFPILTHINTHNGNDTVVTGDEPDKVVLGKGVDSVTTGNGSDSLFAGAGPDTLVGGNGNDQLHAGPGHDTLIAGNGNNIFVDPYGHTTLQGGTGHDTYILIDFRLDPDNNYNPAKDKIKKYVPPSSGNSTSQTVQNILSSVFGDSLI
jgi:Ca2+-binding RTX toxin-like protein